MAYKAVINDTNSLYHLNMNHDRYGRFATGDGDHDGQTEYRDSIRKVRNVSRLGESSREARDRLDAYYRNEGGVHYVSSGSSKMGSSRSRNPYVDNNGRLTDAGERRYEAEKRANRQKSSKNRVDEDALLDPKKWVKDDIKNMEDLAKETRNISDDTGRLVDKIFKTKPKERLDLSHMSDQEIRQILNREQLERQYNDVFNKPEENKGKEFVKTALEVNSIIAAQVVTGLTIAQLIMALA